MTFEDNTVTTLAGEGSVTRPFMEQAKDRLVKEMEEYRCKETRHAASQVYDMLTGLCRVSEEFAQAIVQGGSLEDCVDAVINGYKHRVVFQEAYKRVVQFYFPDADVQAKIKIKLHGAEDESNTDSPSITLDLFGIFFLGE